MNRNISIFLRFALIFVACILFFHQDLRVVFGDATRNEALSYILLIPFMFAFLIYRKWNMIRASGSMATKGFEWGLSSNEAWGFLLLPFSFFIYFYGSYTFTPIEIHMVALPVFVAGCILLLFNTDTMRALIFPLLFLLLLTPPPQEYIYNLGSSMSFASSSFAHHLLVLLHMPVNLTLHYGTPVLLLLLENGETISLAVDVACSGIHSQLGFLAFAVFTAYLMRGKIWKKALLFALGFPTMFLMNGLRISLIAFIGFNFGAELALSAFHLTGGWVLAFIGTVALFLISERILGLKISVFNSPVDCKHVFLKATNFCSSCGEIVASPVNTIPTRDLTKIVGIFGCLLLLLSIQAPLFVITEGTAEVISQTIHGVEATTDIFSSIPDYHVSFLYRDTEFESLAKQDASLAYALTPTSSEKKPVWLALEISDSRYSLHRWETCLITWPMGQGFQAKVNTIESYDVELQANPLLLGRYFVFTYLASNRTQATLYWYEDSAVILNSTVAKRHMKISLVAYPDNMGEIPALKTQLFEIASQMVASWQSMKSWSKVTLFLQQYIDQLLVLFALLTAGYAFLHLYRRSRDATMTRTVYNKLSEERRLIVDAVHQTQKEGTLPTFNAILTTYNEMNSQTVSEPDILKRIRFAEAAGVIKGGIANRKEKPVQIWTRCF